VGTTPVEDHELAAGKHEVRLVNESLGLSLVVSVTIEGGKGTRIVHTFEISSDPAPGTLSVATTPYTTVLVDGVEIGTTPITGHRLDPGVHCVVLVNEGLGIDDKLEVTIVEGKETSLVKQLASKPSTGTLSVATHPWSRVFVNGVDLGTTPIVKHELEPGSYKVKVVNESLGIDESFTVKVVAGEDTRVTREIGGEGGKKKVSGTLSVVTTPWTAVFVDGKKVGNTPIVKKALPAGKHEVKLVSEDLGLEETVTVKIVAGEHTKIVRDLD
jgi:hypothetical protein